MYSGYIEGKNDLSMYDCLSYPSARYYTTFLISLFFISIGIVAFNSANEANIQSSAYRLSMMNDCITSFPSGSIGRLIGL